MLITAIFIMYSLLFILLYNYTQNSSLTAKLAEPIQLRPLNVLVNVLLLFGIPWFFVLSAGTYWGFAVPPDYVRTFRVSQSGALSIWLILTVFLSVALSYVVAFQVGSLSGYREGRYTAIAHFPHFVREDSNGRPCEIRGWKSRDKELVSGSQLYYDGRLFRVVAIEDKGDCHFVVGQYEATLSNSGGTE